MIKQIKLIKGKRLLEIELAGRGRKKHTAYLRRRVGD